MSFTGDDPCEAAYGSAAYLYRNGGFFGCSHLNLWINGHPLVVDDEVYAGESLGGGGSSYGIGPINSHLVAGENSFNYTLVTGDGHDESCSATFFIPSGGGSIGGGGGGGGTPPVLTSVSPLWAATPGGTPVTLNGTFTDDVVVTFDGVPATDVLISSSLITCRTPPHLNMDGTGKIGVALVQVANGDGSMTMSFEWRLPLEPDHGPSDGGTLVHLRGYGFVNGLTIKFGDTPAIPGSILVDSDTQTVICITPPHVIGIVDVVLTNPDGRSFTIPHYTYETSPCFVAPVQGFCIGGTLVTITGGVLDAPFKVGCTVQFGVGRFCDDTTLVLVNDHTITCLSPAHVEPSTKVWNEDLVDVIVTNPDTSTFHGQNAPNTFFYTDPVDPPHGSVDGGETVEITGPVGSNFGGATTVQFVSDSSEVGVPATDVAIIDTEHLTCTTPESPEIAITSNSVGTDADTDPTIIFTDFPDTQPTAGNTDTPPVTGDWVLIAGVVGSVPDINGWQQITVIDSKHFSIPIAVTVAGHDGTFQQARTTAVFINPDGVFFDEASQSGQFVYDPPPHITLLTVVPSAGAPAGGETITLTGTLFDEAATVQFGDNYVDGDTLVFVDAEHLQVVAPPATTIAISGNSNSTPTILSMDTTTIFNPTGAPVLVVISGVIGSVPDINGTRYLTIIDDTHASVPVNVRVAGSGGTIQLVGPVDVVVRNPDHTVARKVNGYTYAVPIVVTSAQPVIGGVAGGLPVTLVGDGFLDGLTVSFGGVFCDGTTVNVVDLQHITCVTPAHAVGPVDIRVTNADNLGATLAGSSYGGFQYTLRAQAPVVTIGPMQSVLGPPPATRTTTAILAAGLNIGDTSFAWTQVSGPGGATISSPSTLNTSIVWPAYVPGTYVFELAVTAQGDSGGLPFVSKVQARFILRTTIPPQISGQG